MEAAHLGAMFADADDALMEYAKYFQNSIREEALVAKARTGIIYARGGGGTLREIFQDVEENYYEEETSKFTPMIFFDPVG